MEIDLMRGIAILAVIIIHVSGHFTNIKHINGLMVTMAILDFFAHIGVPLFVFISGFVLTLSTNKKSFNTKIFYKKRLLRILPPYLFFSIAYILLSSVVLKPIGINLPDIQAVFLKLCTASSFSHLWFIALIVQLYLVFPLLRKFAQTKFFTLATILFTVGVQIIWQISTQYLLFTVKSDNVLQPLIKSYLAGAFISYLGYFLLGMYFAKHNSNILGQLKKIKSYWLVVLMILLLSLISHYYFTLLDLNNDFYNLSWESLTLVRFLNPFLFITTFFFFYKVCLKKVPKIITKTLTLFSKYSFGIYLTHHGILYVAAYLLINFTDYNESTWIFYLLTFSITITFSFAFTYLISLLPKHKYIIG